MFLEDADDKTLFLRFEVLAQSGPDVMKCQKIAGWMLWKVTAGMLLKIHISFKDKALIFSYSPIKAWQAVLTLVFFTLPCPINLISEAFWVTVETGLGNSRGRSCQSIQLTHTVWSDVSACPEITLYRLPVLCLIFPAANISCCFAWVVHISILKIFEHSVYQQPCTTIYCIMSKNKKKLSSSFLFQNHQSVIKGSFTKRILCLTMFMSVDVLWMRSCPHVPSK